MVEQGLANLVCQQIVKHRKRQAEDETQNFDTQKANQKCGKAVENLLELWSKQGSLNLENLEQITQQSSMSSADNPEQLTHLTPKQHYKSRAWVIKPNQRKADAQPSLFVDQDHQMTGLLIQIFVQDWQASKELHKMVVLPLQTVAFTQDYIDSIWTYLDYQAFEIN